MGCVRKLLSSVLKAALSEQGYFKNAGLETWHFRNHLIHRASSRQPLIATVGMVIGISGITKSVSLISVSLATKSSFTGYQGLMWRETIKNYFD